MSTFSIFTLSVGAHQAGHSLPDRLRAIARAGFHGVEVFQDDLDVFAASSELEEFCGSLAAATPPESPQSEVKGLYGGAGAARAGASTTFNAHGSCSADTLRRELAAATYIGQLCAQLNLQVMNLQPMRDVEGYTDPQERETAFQRVRSRFAVMRALGTDLLLCCSTSVPEPRATSSVERIAADLAQLADEAHAYGCSTGTAPLRIGFEALSWGCHIDVWSEAWNVVRMADRANLGLVLDSFNTLGREYADPCNVDGIASPDPMPALRASLADIARVPADKIFFVQIGDARKPLDGPLAPSPNATETRPARMIWSRANRLFPGEVERGAYLPVVEFMRAVAQTGYTSCWSIEVFNSSLHDVDQRVPDEHAERAMRGLRWLRGVV